MARHQTQPDQLGPHPAGGLCPRFDFQFGQLAAPPATATPRPTPVLQGVQRLLVVGCPIPFREAHMSEVILWRDDTRIAERWSPESKMKRITEAYMREQGEKHLHQVEMPSDVDPFDAAFFNAPFWGPDKDPA
jgi:hypothetical protein